MLEQPSDKQVVALARLQNSTDFKTIVEWFDAMLKKQDKQNRVLLDQKLNQGQGVSQTLAHVLEWSDKSKALAKKLR